MHTLAIILIVVAIGVLIWLIFRSLFDDQSAARHHHGIQRETSNPIIKPTGEEWHAQGTFNPAALSDPQGRVHMLYRAVGADGISRLSYASSPDGIHFDDVLPYPVFSMTNPKSTVEEKRYDPVLYPSGGSWGGAEDPRMVAIGDRIYITFNAFDGWDFLRVAITSISKDDFFNKRFAWTKPQLISPQGQVHKNWVLFPEKIHGKFAILHSITPTILIDYVDRLEGITHGSRKIQSREGAPRGGRKDFWDNRVRSAGPPPLKTSRGWLVLYHAVENKEAHKYKLGAMLLDLNDPTKILARSPAPLLEPDMWYENDWKPGIVYACGAVIRHGELLIYYGGGDKYICAAKAPLGPLLDWMLQKGKVK